MDMIASTLNKATLAKYDLPALSSDINHASSVSHHRCLAPLSPKRKSALLLRLMPGRRTNWVLCGARNQTGILPTATNTFKGDLEKEQSQEKRPLHVERFYLPELNCSFPVKRHPDYGNIRKIVDPWMLQWTRPRTEQDEKFYVQTGITGKICLTMPESPYKDRLLNLCKLMACFLCFDDMGDDTAQLGADSTRFHVLVNSMIRALERRASADDLRLPHIKALSPILHSMHADMSPRIYQRHVDTLKNFIDSTRNQTSFREIQLLPDLQAFIHSRRQTVGFRHMQVMVEYCLGIELDDETLESKYIQNLHDAAMDYIAWSNDVLSFRREYFSGDLHNLPSVLYYHHGGNVSFQDVVFESYEMIKQREQDLLDLLAWTTTSDLAARKPELRLYLQNLRYCMSGLLEWFYTSARFHGVDHSVGKIRHGFVHMDPQRTIITPNPIH